MKLLRTIRLDPSDTFIFERAAEPGEWAVSGAFVFSSADLSSLQAGAQRFRGGFLGIASLGCRLWCRSWRPARQIVRR